MEVRFFVMTIIPPKSIIREPEIPGITGVPLGIPITRARSRCMLSASEST